MLDAMVWYRNGKHYYLYHHHTSTLLILPQAQASKILSYGELIHVRITHVVMDEDGSPRVVVHM